MISNTDITTDGLTSELRLVLSMAIRILGGAHLNHRLDDQTEVMSEGIPYLVSTNTISISKALVEFTQLGLLRSFGYNPPYSPEVISKCYQFMSDALQRGLVDHRLKVFFLGADEGGCAHWRCDTPAEMLRRKYPNIIYTESARSLEYSALLPFDVIVVQNGIFGASTASVMGIVQRLKDAGKIIVYDVDDDFDSIPLDNIAHYQMSHIEGRAIDWLRSESDAIFTTVPHLANKIGRPDKTFVLPNSIAWRDFPPIDTPADRDDFLLVAWHGGSSHERDIDSVARQLCSLIDDNKNLESKIGKKIYWAFMGYFPEILRPYLEFKTMAFMPEKYERTDPDLRAKLESVVVKGRQGVRYIQGVPVRQFHRYLMRLNPDISICPLVMKSEFNISKSNIKVQESVLAGSAVVVSDTGPFKNIPDDVVAKARTPEQFSSRIRELILSEEKRKHFQVNGALWLTKECDLEKNIYLWMDALCQITGNSMSDLVNANRPDNTDFIMR